MTDGLLKGNYLDTGRKTYGDKNDVKPQKQDRQSYTNQGIWD